MAFAVDGGIEWEKDETNKVLTIRPTDNPESGYERGQMKNFAINAPWGKITDSGWTLVLESGITFIGGRAFNNCIGFTGTLKIPNGVTSIGARAFRYCTGFNGTLTIPNSVTLIRSNAFQECSGFNGSLIIPNSVTEIDFHAFAHCSGFNGSLIIPNSVTSIDYNAFNYCSGFISVVFLAENPSLGSDSFALGTGESVVKCYSPGNSAEGVINAPVISPGVNWEFHRYNPQFFKVDGEWKKCRMYTKQSGLWKLGAPYEKGEGGWK